MKKIISLLAAVLAFGVGNACVKKSPLTTNPSPLTTNPSPLTLIVMDTTQALLPEATVKVGKKIYKTSFDGRVVLQPEQLADVQSIVVSCADYHDRKVTPNGQGTLLVRLTPQARKSKSGKEKVYYTLGTTRTARADMIYATMSAAKPMADFVETEEAAFVAAESSTMANNISAGKLTAGEVNDFAKWSFWSHILDSTHRQFIKTWGLEPRERYTVAVTDKHGYPVVNYPVNLTDNNGNTLFQALTDNTGKAELWNGLTAKGRVANGEWHEGWNTLVVDAPCERNDAVDVCFVFDATGSMVDELRYLQAEMKDVIARASEATGGLKIRTGAVVYRDHSDEYITRLSRLTDDIATTQAFIDKQEANGGGDYPEAVPEALMAALNSAGWDETARARILFLVLDAPCHEDSATLALLHEQVLNAAALGVRIVPVVCSGIGESGEYLLRAIALATNGTSFFLTDDSGIGHTHLKPTTDSIRVEHLNDMLVRTIVEFSYMPDCKGRWHEDEISNVREESIPNPFDAEDLAKDPSIPHGPTTLYLLDVSGKLITTYEGLLDEAGDSQLARLHLWLPTGIYFVKAFYDGQWHTKKILVH